MARKDSYPAWPERPDDASGERDVEYWLGIYKSIDEVPDRYRLGNYESEFAGEDTWSEYLATRDDLAESTKKNSCIPAATASRSSCRRR
jgi:hypothetical protein